METGELVQELQLDKSNWTKVKLGEVVKEVRDNAKDLEAEGIQRVVSLGDIESEDIHLNSWSDIEEGTTFKRKFKAGQVLFGRRRAYLKKAALATFSGVCSGDIIVMEAKKDLNPKLLPFLINNDKFFDFAVANSAGSLSPRAKFKDLANYEFLLPPKEEQARLAELLWAMDEVVEKDIKLREKLTTLRDICREKFFTYGLSIKPKLKKGKTGQIRNDWDEKKFSNIVEIESGQVDPKEDKYSSLIQIGSERIEPNTGRILEYKTAKELNIKSGNYLFTEDHLIYSKIRPYFKKVANPRFKGLCSADIYPLLPNKSIISKDFLFYFLLTEKFTRKILRFQNRTGMPKVNRDELNSIFVPIPSLEEQTKIVQKLDQIDYNLDLLNDRVEKSQSLQKTLINQIF